MRKDTYSSIIYASHGRILLVGDLLENEDHSHHALQITLNLEPRPFAIHLADGTLHSDCALISPNCPHRVESHDSWRAIILLDPESRIARRIAAHRFADRTVSLPTSDITDRCRQLLHPFIGRERSPQEADRAITAVSEAFAGPPDAAQPYDERIEALIQLIRSAELKQLALSRLAAAMNLSESRLSHLFKQEVGIALRRYLLWYKLYRAGFSICRGEPMTTAAEDAGFADTAHFSRTFKAMFGMSPSQILRRSDAVRVVGDGD